MFLIFHGMEEEVVEVLFPIIVTTHCLLLEVEQVDAPRPGSAHVVVECSGSAGGLAAAFEAVRPAGVVCLVGMPEGQALPLAPGVLFRQELVVLASFAGTSERTMAEAVCCLEQDEGFFRSLLGHVIPLEEVGPALVEWRPRPGTRTVVALGEGGGR